jgi:hypothetical protein
MHFVKDIRIYEQLRGFVPEAQGLPGQVYGLDVLMRKGCGPE